MISLHHRQFARLNHTQKRTLLALLQFASGSADR
jgi:hypothetical protein